jgi:hypothetical protein
MPKDNVCCMRGQESKAAQKLYFVIAIEVDIPFVILLSDNVDSI